MKTINISLPESMQAYVEEIVEKEGYSNLSEYFRELVRQDQKRKATEKIESLLLEGLDSGTPSDMTKEDWRDIRSTVRQRLAQ